MKHTTKIAAFCLLAVASASHAQMARKEVVLDTGEGGIELTVSVPSNAAGPYDFSSNNGIGGGVVTANGITVKGKEVLFGGKAGETGKLLYRATATTTTSNNTKFTNDGIASELLKKNGQKFSDAKPIVTESALLDGGKNVTYTVCSKLVFEKPTSEFSCSIIQTSVSVDGKRSSALMVSIVESDIEKYNANPSKYQNGVSKMFADATNNSKARLK